MRAAPPREDKPLLGMVLGAAAFLCFALVDASAKFSVGLGMPVLIVVFFRYAVNFVAILAYYVPKEGKDALISNVPRLQTIRSIMLLSSTALNFMALKFLPMTITIPIFFAIPLIVCVLSVPMLGEQVGLKRYAAVIVGFLGVLIILRPGGVSFEPAMLISVCASFSGALYFILTRMIAGRDGTAVSQVFPSGFATLCLIPLAVVFWEPPSSLLLWGVLISAGVLAGLGHTFLTVAYRVQEASKIAPLVYTQIIYVTAISWVVFGDLPDFWTIVGTCVIIGSGLFLWLRERQVES